MSQLICEAKTEATMVLGTVAVRGANTKRKGRAWGALNSSAQRAHDATIGALSWPSKKSSIPAR